MSYAAIAETLNTGGLVLLDGATGTELQRRGVPMDQTAWCGRGALENADVLQQIHADYVAAGSNIITANTFATSRYVLDAVGSGDAFEEVNRITLDAALAVREDHPNIVVAGSISHMFPRRDLHGDPDPARMRDAQFELAETLAHAGADLILLEMMFNPDLMENAFAAAKATGLPVWAGFSARRGADGSVLSFHQRLDIPFAEIVPILADFDIAAAGVMHSESEVTGAALAEIRKVFDGPLTAYPDSGHMKLPEWQFEEVIAPADLRDYAAGWLRSGVQVLGGCCGLGVAHIEALATLR